MVTALRLFRLEVKTPSPAPVKQAGEEARPRWRVTAGLRLAGAALAVVTVVVGIADGGFGRYSPVAGDLGSPRLISFTDSPIVPDGWSVEPIAHYPWANQYFGSGALWTRYQFAPTLSAAGSGTVLADVINTSDLQSFSTYDVIACYDYHGYGLSAEKRVGLGDGVEATELTFTVPSLSGSWNALYWVWPVKSGSGVRYERIVLLDPVNGSYLAGAAGSTTNLRVAAEETASRSFLRTFAQQMVDNRTAGQPAKTVAAKTVAASS
jgi:hypothetical protein